MGNASSNMGEYTVGCRCFAGTTNCEECKTMYKSGYEFMYLSCCCGCGTSFRICSICSPMYMRCDCGCKGSFDICKQRPEYGNVNVSIFDYFLFLFLPIWTNSVKLNVRIKCF